MCNPRRVRVSATRQLQEAWQREVTRNVQLSEVVTGEARVRQALDTTVGAPALTALEAVLAEGQPGWSETDGGYRAEVDGGHVVYNLDTRTLEIVAVLSDEVRAAGEAARLLTGELTTEISVEGESQYYDDGWGGRGEKDAERDAERDAQQKLDDEARRRVHEAEQQAEQTSADSIENEARDQAEQRLSREAARRRQELQQQAQQQLESVGLQCRQEFHRVLALAYRNAILTYARANGAENVQCTEADDALEIEFSANL